MAFADPNEIFFTPFEPKLKNRFIMEIDGIPAYLVKTMARHQSPLTQLLWTISM